MPSMVVTRAGFTQVIANAFAGLGFSAEGPSIYEYPLGMFEEGGDLTALTENIDKVVYGLTKWEPQVKEVGLTPAAKLTVAGKDYQEAFDKMNIEFLKDLSGDGLPIVPVTEERISWILMGTDLPRDRQVGRILPRGGIATVETVAAALGMAGGRPEYLPVLMAAIDAMLQEDFQHQSMNATMNSVHPVAIVNGPIAKQIRLNAGFGCLSPDPQRSAGASIGRAIRLLLMSAGGAVPGLGTMSGFGGPGRYTGLVFAEDEEGLPEGWEPLSVERGFARGSNTVTLHAVNGTMNCSSGTLCPVPGAPEVREPLLDGYAAFMQTTKQMYFGTYTGAIWYNGSPGVLLINRGRAAKLADAGWTKEAVKEYLWQVSKIPDSPNLRQQIESAVTNGMLDEKDVEYPFPITRTPEQIMIVMAGAWTTGNGYWMPAGIAPNDLTDAEIEVPAKWDALIDQALEELGAIPAVMEGVLL